LLLKHIKYKVDKTDIKLTLYRMELLQSNKPIIGNIIYASTKWYDNRCVQLLSNIVGAEPVQKVRRYGKKVKQNVEISCPNAVVTYNKFMGGMQRNP